MPKIDCVFINNSNHLGLPSLIDAYDRSTTRLEDLNIWQESIVYPRPEMNHILKMWKFLSTIDDDIERRGLMNKIIELAIKNKDKAFKK